MASSAYCQNRSASFMTVSCLGAPIGVLLIAEPLPTETGCLCKNAHSATRRDVASVFRFFLGTRGAQPIVCWGS
jgi:hypothetical protein